MASISTASRTAQQTEQLSLRLGRSFNNYYNLTTSSSGKQIYTSTEQFPNHETDIRMSWPCKRIVLLRRRFPPQERQALCLHNNYARREAIIMFTTATRQYSRPCTCCRNNPTVPFPTVLRCQIWVYRQKKNPSTATTATAPVSGETRIPLFRMISTQNYLNLTLFES